MNDLNRSRNLRVVCFFLALVLGVLLAASGPAQTFTTLHSFTAYSFGSYTNSDGAGPVAGLVLSGSTLYGAAVAGGSSDCGTVFAINTDGSGFANLHSFTGGSDGDTPRSMILSDNTLYGTTLGATVGTVFSMNTDGTGFTNLHNFLAGTPNSTNSDGSYLYAGLVLSGSTLYGAAMAGGSSGNGTVFAVNTDGTGFTTLHSFTARDPDYGTNSDGFWPFAKLVLAGNTLYGTASLGGSFGGGTVFSINTDGTGFTTLHNFNNSDGTEPYGGLVLSGSTLYGTAYYGGSFGYGTVFKVNTDGSGFVNLHNFTRVFPHGNTFTNSDGTLPYAGLVLSGNTLYGTASAGGSFGGPSALGSFGVGTVFAVNTDGTGFTNLHSFDPGSDGKFPFGGLVLSGNTLYGTASGGGSSGNGTVFSLSFTPQLTITPSGDDVILSWPTNVAGFDYTSYRLQSTTNLGSPLWTTNLPPPVVVNGQNTVTNPISGARQFYRLSQ